MHKLPFATQRRPRKPQDASGVAAGESRLPGSSALNSPLLSRNPSPRRPQTELHHQIDIKANKKRQLGRLASEDCSPALHAGFMACHVNLESKHGGL